MDFLGSVQQKMPCVFETEVLQEQSAKRAYQQYKVVATERVRQTAVTSGVFSAWATEKMDGTCVYIAKFNDKPCLWARFDRKPTKEAHERFRKFKQLQETQDSTGDKFAWDLQKTSGEENDDSGDLRLELVPLAEMEGHTAELVGTTINGNPYGLGTKTCPLHFLVIHGSLPLRDPPDISAAAIRDWFLDKGQIEGIVWHCANKTLFKVHRHHVSLAWPMESPELSRRQVKLLVDGAVFEDSEKENPVFACLSRLYGHRYETLAELIDLMYEQATGDDTETKDKRGQRQRRSEKK